MKIPSRIKIGGHSIRVVTCPFVRDGKATVRGLTEYPERRMRLATHYLKPNHRSGRICESEMAVTFMHEIVHHVEDVYGANMSEKQVTRLAEGLLQVFRDNPLNFRAIRRKNMPLTAKGKKVMGAMKKTYGSDEKAKEVFYASANSGKLKGVHGKHKKAKKRR